MKALLVLLMLAGSAFAEDARTVVPLDASQREHVLGEMRGFLATVERVTAALSRGDFDELSAAAPPGPVRMPPDIAQKLPPAFRQMAMSTHQQIAAIGADAAKRDSQHSLEQTSRLLQTCNACHAAYRF